MCHQARALKAPVDENRGKIALSSDCLTIDGLVKICFAIRLVCAKFYNLFDEYIANVWQVKLKALCRAACCSHKAMLSQSIAGGHYTRMRRAQDIDEAGIRYSISEQCRNVCHDLQCELFWPRKASLVGRRYFRVKHGSLSNYRDYRDAQVSDKQSTTCKKVHWVQTKALQSHPSII